LLGDGAVAVSAWYLRGLPVPVILRWLIWLLCFVVMLQILQDAIVASMRLPAKTRHLIKSVLVLIFCVSFYGLANSQWRQEQSALLTGYISSGVSVPDWQSHPERIVEIGPGRSLDLRFTDGPQINALYDAGIRVSMGMYGPELSTVVRDRYGNRVAIIDKNHWTVFSGCSDKNYTKSSLEILDNRGHVVLQLHLFPDHIQLQGEWRDEFGNGMRLNNGYLSWWHNPQTELKLEQLINPLFEYPSSDHWGESRLTLSRN
jgi:hypothetical protein